MSTESLPESLSAKYKESFAYETVKDRMPVILTKAIDTIYKQTTPFGEKYGEPGSEDVKRVVGELSKLRSEMMTDKPFVEIDDNFGDASKWNEDLDRLRKQQKEPPSFFTSPWLFAECTMYRRITCSLQKSEFLKSFDPYYPQKSEALEQALPGLATMAEYLENFAAEKPKQKNLLWPYFRTFLKASLWSNRFDLSLTAGEHRDHESHDPVDTLKALEEYLLADESERIFEYIFGVREISRKLQKIRVDIVLDNAGFEFSSDLLLAEFLLESNLADRIVFHVKNMPWFVSDVTSADFHYTISKLAAQDSTAISKYGKLWQSRLEDGTFVLVPNNLCEYWTLPTPYHEMRKRDPELYRFLQSSKLVIFKGDMNFRKLTADLSWGDETPFTKSLQGFQPAPLCTLRTLKADLVVGLKPGKAQEAAQKDKDWMVSGKYAIILFSNPE